MADVSGTEIVHRYSSLQLGCCALGDIYLYILYMCCVTTVIRDRTHILPIPSLQRIFSPVREGLEAHKDEEHHGVYGAERQELDNAVVDQHSDQGDRGPLSK